MNAQTFLENLGHIASAPGGVKRLREMILHCAVSGRLVAQNDSEGIAEWDIERAEILREDFQQRYKIRNRKPIGPIRNEEIPFPIPANWKWARMESIAAYIQRGKGPSYAESGRALVVSQKCIQWAGFDLALARRISDESMENYGGERFLKENDILWNSTGTGTAGRVALYTDNQDPIVADSHVTVIRLSNFIPQYVWCYLASPTIQAKMAPNQEGSMVSGTTNQVELSTGKVSELPIPCPPIQEQKRIIARVDELMALCDKLEAQQQDREQRFPVLSTALHARLVESPSLANLNAIFDELVIVPTEDFRKTILALAIRGLLVEQLSDDEPAEELLKKIASEKKILVSERKAKATLKLHRSAKKNPPPWTPSGWCWRRFADVIWCFRGHNPPKTEFINHPRKGYVRFIQITDFKTDSRITYVPESPKNKMVYKGEIIMAAYRHIGKLSRSMEGAFNVALCKVLEIQPMSRDFVELLIGTELVKGELLAASERAHIPSMHSDHLLSLWIPVPPLAEQNRIVAKVNQLMKLLDSLETLQNKKTKIAQTFAQAAVTAITGTEIKEQV